MKRLLALLLTIIVVLPILFNLPVYVSAESLYIRKIVSVVYDDSGSMSNGGSVNWAYANYALQSFCGLLNSDDQLYVTYMSEAEKNSNLDPQRVDLGASKIQASVDSIRKQVKKGNTPYNSIDIAFRKLQSVQDPNVNTQYWLVVITDGEFQSSNKVVSETELTEKLNSYVNTKMPNGSTPQISYLAIGSDVTKPNENKSAGLFVYTAKGASDITKTMSEIADKVSGRSRLSASDIVKKDSNTLEISSAVPLLNIAVLAQKTSAKITSVSNDNNSLFIAKYASIKYPERSGWKTDNSLAGGTFLINNANDNIPAGKYQIEFDDDVDLDNVVIMFEPALEMRMTIAVNGKEILDHDKLDDLMENDKISVSYKIYEIGTDKEVDPSLLPPGTKFEITVLENGSVVAQESGKGKFLSDHVVKNVDTEIKASIIIEGFNPIDYSAKFTPSKYVPKVVYSITSDYGSNVKSVKLDNIATNKDLSICFTVYADGVAITDPNAVRMLNPVIGVSPQGNDGTISYSNDGKIVFTPNAASMNSTAEGSFDVDVTCTLDDGTASKATYTVLISEYQVVPLDTDKTIKKTELFDNQVSVSFYITKDGVKLDKYAVEKHISVLLNEEYASIKTNVAVATDGTITITPYSEEQHTLTFWNWWTNWAYYFGLESKDIMVTLNHAFGAADSIIDIIDADAKYLIFNVYAPLIIEILLLAAIIAYIVRYFTKARFASNGVLYVGSIARNRGNAGTHCLELLEVHLKQFNKFKNLWNPFKELTVSANGVNITAAKGNRILCNEAFPWYSDGIRPKARTVRIDSPKDVVNYCQENDELVIHEIKTVRVMDEQNRMISQDDSVYYFARADITYVKVGTKQTEVIDSAVAFCYSTIQN